MQSDNFYADSLHYYLKQILKIPSLSPEEVHCYAKQVQQMKHLLELKADLCTKLSHDPTFAQWSIKARLSESALKFSLQEGKRAKRMLIEANLRLVVAIARQYQNRGVDLLDLIQEGTIGLQQGAEKFDPTRGYRFSTYVKWWIRREVSRAVSAKSKKSTVIDSELTEILEKLESELPQPEETLALNERREWVKQMVSRLPSRQRDVLILFYGLCDRHPCTFSQIARQLQLSYDQVRYAHSQGLKTLELTSSPLQADGDS